MTENHPCPHCGQLNELHSGPGPDDVPEPGDVSICWGCRGLAFFTVFGLRKPTAEEAVQLAADPGVRSALGAMAEAFTPEQASSLRWGDG